MRYRSIIISFITIIFFSTPLMAQNKKDVVGKLFSNIVGTWKIQTIYNGKKDITSKDSTKVQWLEFAEDGHYKRLTGRVATDSGSYRVNENHRSLYLQSVIGNGSDKTTEWKADVKENRMTLIKEGGAKTSRLRYLYIKTENKATAIRSQQ